MQTLTAEERARLVSYLPAEMRENPMLEAWIDGALLTVSRRYFGESFVYALSLYVAHKATLAGRSNGESGAVTSVREGDISISFGGNGGSGDDFLGSTGYGVEFLELKKQHRVCPGVTGRICGMGGMFGHLA